ncbi:MAG: TatA/E family twin arginine-targeting protein translocase [Leptolyngbyaceae cyanobacterium]
MNVFGIGLPEMAVIFIVALLVFGPRKLPEIGRSLGKALRSFQDATKEFESEFKQEVEKIEQVVKEPMTATIEPPQPKAIRSGDGEASDAEGLSAASNPIVDGSPASDSPVLSSNSGDDSLVESNATPPTASANDAVNETVG